MLRKFTAELIGTAWLVLGGCGSAVLAAGFPTLGIGFVGVAFAFGLLFVGFFGFGFRRVFLVLRHHGGHGRSGEYGSDQRCKQLAHCFFLLGGW